MQAVVLAFTLKGQDEEKIVLRIREIRQLYPKVILIHGFMPRKLVEEKGWSTKIIDELEQFPVRLNMYDGKPLREEMATVASKLKANVIVIGEIKEGVLEEVNLYKQKFLEVYNYSIDGQYTIPSGSSDE